MIGSKVPTLAASPVPRRSEASPGIRSAFPDAAHGLLRATFAAQPAMEDTP